MDDPGSDAGHDTAGDNRDDSARDSADDGDSRDDSESGGESDDRENQDRDDTGTLGSDASLTRPDIGSSFRDSQPSRDFGFPEFRDLGASGGYNRDGDLTASKDFALGAWEFVTGQDRTIEGVIDFVTGAHSAKELGIGIAVGAAAFVLGPDLILGGEIAATSDSILGTDLLPGVTAFAQSVGTSAGLGAMATEAVGMYNNITTRIEGLVKLNQAGRELRSSRAATDHIPGETRSTRKETAP
jgi:hypothetical protein